MRTLMSRTRWFQAALFSLLLSAASSFTLDGQSKSRVRCRTPRMPRPALEAGRQSPSPDHDVNSQSDPKPKCHNGVSRRLRKVLRLPTKRDCVTFAVAALAWTRGPSALVGGSANTHNPNVAHAAIRVKFVGAEVKVAGKKDVIQKFATFETPPSLAKKAKKASTTPPLATKKAKVVAKKASKSTKKAVEKTAKKSQSSKKAVAKTVDNRRVRDTSTERNNNMFPISSTAAVVLAAGGGILLAQLAAQEDDSTTTNNDDDERDSVDSGEEQRAKEASKQVKKILGGLKKSQANVKKESSDYLNSLNSQPKPLGKKLKRVRNKVGMTGNYLDDLDEKGPFEITAPSGTTGRFFSSFVGGEVPQDAANEDEPEPPQTKTEPGASRLDRL